MRASLLVAAALTAGAAAATVALGAAGSGERLSGRVSLTEKGRPSKGRSLDAGSGAVWYVPDGKLEPPRPIAAEMTTIRKQFAPRLLVVPVGSTVRFPNQDPILHNVFSVSGGNAFDLGLVGAGQGKGATFREAGVVRVFCNVHHAMFAHVVVVETPWAVQLGSDGSFDLAGLPPGRGTLHVWHERAEPLALPLTLPHPAPLSLDLEVTLPRVPPHRNKFGRSYYGGNAYDDGR